jgi:hypothetical protein
VRAAQTALKFGWFGVGAWGRHLRSGACRDWRHKPQQADEVLVVSHAARA